jgi:hypothetical protein
MPRGDGLRPGVKPLYELFFFVRWEAIPGHRANSERMVPGIDHRIVLSATLSKGEQVDQQ